MGMMGKKVTAGDDTDSDAPSDAELAALDAHAAATRESRDIISKIAEHEASVARERRAEPSTGEFGEEPPTRIEHGASMFHPLRGVVSADDRPTPVARPMLGPLTPPAPLPALPPRQVPARVAPPEPEPLRPPPRRARWPLVLAAVAMSLVAGWLVLERRRSERAIAVPTDLPSAEAPAPTPPATEPAAATPGSTANEGRPAERIHKSQGVEAPAPAAVAKKPAPPPARGRPRDETADRTGASAGDSTEPGEDRPPTAAPPAGEPPRAHVELLPASGSPLAGRDPSPAGQATPPARVTGSTPGPPGATAPPAPNPSLPRIFVSENSDRLARMCRQIEASVVAQAGVNPDFARNITVPLRRTIRPNSPIYPIAMYYFIVREAAAKRDPRTAAANLAAAQTSGRLRD
jgi:hypothetical protein